MPEKWLKTLRIVFLLLASERYGLVSGRSPDRQRISERTPIIESEIRSLE
jgi:hypothetical protein